MAYDEGLAFRLRELFVDRRDVIEKSMFGGLAFLVDGNMSVGVVGEDLVVRVGAERHDAALAKPHARIMDFTGRPMKGWIFVSPEGITEDAALQAWVAWGVETARTAASKPAAAKKKSMARKATTAPKGKSATKRR